MRKGVLEKQRAALEYHGLDALVAASPDNVAYVLGFGIPSQTLAVRNRMFLPIVGRNGIPHMVAASPEVTFINSQPGPPNVISYDEFADDPMVGVANALKQIGLSRQRVGIEMDFLPAMHYAQLVRQLPGVEFVPAGPVFCDLRMHKTPEEIAALRRVNGAARRAWRKGLGSASVGISERQLARLIIDALYDEGVDEVRLIQVGSGERSSFANPYPTDRRIGKGDLVKIDIMATIDGYYSDTGGAAVAGVVPTEYERIWSTMLQTQRALLEAVRPGVGTRALWDLFERKFAEGGLKPVNRFIGHSLGLSLHEEPLIGQHGDVPLAEGMVMAIEPVYKDPGRLGFHMEDVVVITRDGYDPFTDSSDYESMMVIR